MHIRVGDKCAGAATSWIHLNSLSAYYVAISVLDTGDTKVAKASAHKTKVSANNHTNVKLLSVTNGTRKSYTMTGKPLAKAFFFLEVKEVSPKDSRGVILPRGER